MMPLHPRIRTLIIAEAASPRLTGAALVGWSCARAIAAKTDAHIVTEWRNRDDFLRAGMVEGRDFTAINNSRLQHLSWSLATQFSRKGGFNWRLYAMLSNLVYPFFERKLWQAFGPRLRAGEFDLVHRLLPLSSTTASWIAPRLKKIGVPFVLGPLNGSAPWPQGVDDLRQQERDGAGWLRARYRFSPGLKQTRESASAIIAASRTTLREMPAQSRHRCVFIPDNAVDVEKFPLTPKTAPGTDSSQPLRISFVGRLVPSKGVDMLIAAAAPLIRNGALLLDIIGEGPERERLQVLVQRKGITGGVRMDGWIPHAQLGARLRESDLFVFPCVRESGGAAVLEAMALGIPSVVLDHGDPPELAPPGAGYLLPMTTREGIVSRLSQLLAELKEDPAQLHNAGELAQAHVRKFYSWEARAVQINEVYRWVLGHRACKPDWGVPMGFPDQTDYQETPAQPIPESLLVPGLGF